MFPVPPSFLLATNVHTAIHSNAELDQAGAESNGDVGDLPQINFKSEQTLNVILRHLALIP